MDMGVPKNALQADGFNPNIVLPFELRRDDIRAAAQDVYDFFFDVNSGLVAKGLERLDDMLRPAIMSGVLLGQVTVADFRKNERGELGTRTATLHAEGIAKLRRSWVYRAQSSGAAESVRNAVSLGMASTARSK
jgi:hypothetical protein